MADQGREHDCAHLWGYLTTALETAAADGHPVPCDPDGIPTVPKAWLSATAREQS